MDTMRLIIEIITLIFIAVYVIKTWDIANSNRQTVEEMKRSRIKEALPYVIIYFHIRSNHIIEIVVKNIGRTPAKNIKVSSEPKIRSSENIINVYIDKILANGIASLAPDQEMRFMLDVAHQYLGKELPKEYNVEISFGNELTNEISTIQQIIDINSVEGKTGGNLYDLGDIKEELIEIRKALINLGKSR